MDLGLRVGEPTNTVECSICFDAVREDVGRSIAKLKCGHQFHLDCIGSAFNAKGVMQCPNCRKVEEGEWLYANGSSSGSGSSPVPEYITLEEFIFDDTLPEMEHREQPIQFFPLRRSSSENQASFEEGEFSPAPSFADWDNLRHHSISTELPAVTSVVDPSPYMAYMQPILPSYFSCFPVPIDGSHEYYRHFSLCYQTSYTTSPPQFYSPIHSATLAPIYTGAGMRGFDSNALLVAGYRTRDSFPDLPHSRPRGSADEIYQHHSLYQQDNRLSSMPQSGGLRDTRSIPTLQEQTSYFLIQQPISSHSGAVNAENASSDPLTTLGLELFTTHQFIPIGNEDIGPRHLLQSTGSNAAHSWRNSSPGEVERVSTVIEL